MTKRTYFHGHRDGHRPHRRSRPAGQESQPGRRRRGQSAGCRADTMTPRLWPAAGGPGRSCAGPGAPHAGPPGAVVPVTTAPARPRRRWGTAAGVAGIVAVAAGAGWAIYRERATLREGLRVLSAHTEPDWVIACVGMQCLSMVCFALLQQRLLEAGGARLTAPWLLSTGYLANAVAAVSARCPSCSSSSPSPGPGNSLAPATVTSCRS